MARFIQIVVVAITLLSCVGCDQATKSVAKEYLPRNEVLSFARDTFRLQYAENKGAFLSIGSSLPEKARGLLFTVGIGAIEHSATQVSANRVTPAKADLRLTDHQRLRQLLGTK